jgi:hypothetical protein
MSTQSSRLPAAGVRGLSQDVGARHASPSRDPERYHEQNRADPDGRGSPATVTVILSTHIVDDVRELCPRMAMISNGELLLEGAPSEALDSLVGKIWSKVVATDDELRALEVPSTSSPLTLSVAFMKSASMSTPVPVTASVP